MGVIAQIRGSRPAPPEHVPAPLSAARDELRRQISLAAGARREAAALGERNANLQRPLNDEKEALSRLTGCREADSKILGEWIAGGSIGARPLPSAETVAAENTLLALALDCSAARAALPKSEEDLAAVIARLGGLQAGKVRAVGNVLATEVVPELLAELRQRFEAMLNIEARLRAIIGEFRTHAEIAGLAEAVEQGIRAVRSEAGVLREEAWARALWSELAVNPAHEVRP